MKKKYESPMAIEEAFVANNYVSACSIRISSTSTANKMQCINPTHSHSRTNGGSYYFAGVWVDATITECNIVITQNSKKTSILNGNVNTPASGTSVYSLNGGENGLTTNARYNGYYVPTTGNGWNTKVVDECYGAYRYEGTYSEIREKIHS